MKVGVIGGGAAGFFYAINFCIKNPKAEVTIYEQSKEVLNKVRISGGGRCNVTHACFVPRDLATHYPRGQKELLGPFHTFACGDTMEWFDNRGVALKIEDDGRIFPESNTSQTIIDCLLDECKKYKIKIRTGHKVTNIQQGLNEKWVLSINQKEVAVDRLFIATGSSPFSWKIMKKIGHKIIPAVPSLFTFKIRDGKIRDLPGISMPEASVKVLDSDLIDAGPLLITHWGLSGPAVLKLSAWGAVILHQKNHHFSISVDWIPTIDAEDIIEFKQQSGAKKVLAKSPFGIPNRLWQSLLSDHQLTEKRWGDLSKVALQRLIDQLKKHIFEVKGKATFKEEFVTAGGIDLKEINFKSFSSKLHRNLYFAGEVLNIDAITGGFNFQAAWTGAYIASQAD